MTDRERLTCLLSEYDFDPTFCNICKRPDDDCAVCGSERLADYLIAYGVVVLPCKVGDTVYHLYPKQGIKSNKVKRIQVGTYGMMIADRNGVFRVEEINKTVFLTREEAENALNDMGVDESQ